MPIPIITSSKIITTVNTNATDTMSSSPSTNSSSTPVLTNQQVIIQDIDTTKYEEIPAKEPDLTRQPEKSALKKANGVKRRIIPVLRENQRPSPRPSPKFSSNVRSVSTLSKSMIEQRSHSDDSSSSDDEDVSTTDKRFVHVKRNDSLARFLKDRPTPTDLYEKNILVDTTDERKHQRENIENKLERKLSLRPRVEDLEARNILRAKTAAELNEEKEAKKRYLIRKLSFRPSIQGNRKTSSIKY